MHKLAPGSAIRVVISWYVPVRPRFRRIVRPSVVACQAFRAVDEKGAGFIETAKMNELLVSKGTPFRAKEIEAFLSVAKVD